MDRMRLVFIARYRDGQRRVLGDIVKVLQEMLAGTAEEDCEEK